MSEQGVENHAHLDKLKEALDSSSDKNRNFLIVFLLLEFYIFIAVLGTTDLDLFLASSFYTFPFIQFQISLEQFYLVAPFLLLAFHFNLLFNFVEHCKTLRAWSDEVNRLGAKRAEQLSLLRAFIINTRAKYDRHFDVSGNGKKYKRNSNFFILNCIFVCFIFVFPLALQVFILWKFAAFQSLVYTGLHWLAVSKTIALVFRYWPAIQNPNLIELDAHEPNETKFTFANVTSYGWLCLWTGLAFIVACVRASYMYQYDKATEQVPEPLLALKLPWLKPTLTIEDKDIKRLSSSAIERKESSVRYGKAKKELDTITKDHPKKYTEISHCQNDEQYQEIVLKERSFKGLSLQEVVICNVNLKKAKLHFATISKSTFSGRFDEAVFNYSDLNDVRFQMNSSFNQTEFIGVKSDKNNAKVIANRVSFIANDFSGAKFIDSEFNKSSFTGSDLNGVEFINSDMLAVDFYLAKDFNGSESLLTANITGCVIGREAIDGDAVDYSACEVKDKQGGADRLGANNITNTQGGNSSQQGDNTSQQTTTASTEIPQEVFDRIAAVKASNGDRIILNGFGLTQLPSQLLELQQLKVVYLAQNRLDHNQLRLLINAMPNLQELTIRDNNLVLIPNEITELKQLTWLSIGYNPLGGGQKALAQIDKLSALVKLDNLFIGGIELEGLPTSFSRFKNLKGLSLSNNNFSQVPELVWQLTQLEALYIRNNQLKSISADIGNLTKLDTLWAYDNQLTTLPRELLSLPISSLRAGNNKLPTELQQQLDSNKDDQFDILKQWFADNPDIWR